MHIEDIDMNMAVFTTKNVMKNGLTIVRVSHGDDGYWQFFDAVSTNSNENIMLVSMGSVLNMDESLRAILKMEPSHRASREGKNQDWIVEKYIEEEE